MSEDSLKQSIREEVIEEPDIDQPYQERCLELLDTKYGKLDFPEGRVDLDRVKIKGYKGISKLDYKFSDRATIFRGRNSQGKSSLIKALRFNALGRKDGNNALVTKPINKEADTLETHGFWRKNSSIFKITRTMEEKQGYTGYDEPNIVENPDEDSEGEDGVSERQTQSEVDDLLGISPLYEEGVDRFNAFSLFTVIDGDLTRFYGSDDTADIIEFLFGIRLTKLRRAVEKAISETKLDDTEENAWSKRHEFKSKAEELAEKVDGLLNQREQVESELLELQSDREELVQLLENKDEINDYLNTKIKIKDEITDLQSREEKVEERFKNIKQEISKLESEAVTEDIAPALQEMQQYLAIPNHCPVCTSDISSDRKENFHAENACPLCGEHVPPERRETVSEVDQQGEILEQEKRQQELEELDHKRREIKGELEHLREEISRKRDRLTKIEEEQKQSSYQEYKQRKENLDEKIAELESELDYLREQIVSKRERLHETAIEHLRWEQILREAQELERKKSALKKFQSIIDDERKSARDNLKADIRKRMESFLDRFEEGTFEHANGVRMADGRSYSFTIDSRFGTNHNPSLLDEANAELTLHMLLFHTAILSLLQERMDTIPFRVFLIDSPYGNGQDSENIRDITNFLKEIPQILTEFQVIGTMAEPTFDHWRKLKDTYLLTAIEEHMDS
jgi:DNA repair exonuclease SbcCD ATPase subunit